MLLGKTNITLDSKGRIAIPARYREQLMDACEGKLVVALNPFDGCLNIYPQDEWKKCMRKMEQVQDKSHDFRKVQRIIYSNSHEIDMDGSGRVLIPQESRDSVGLEKNAVLVGHNEKFELWSEAAWLLVDQESSEVFKDVHSSRPDRLNVGFNM